MMNMKKWKRLNKREQVALLVEYSNNIIVINGDKLNDNISLKEFINTPENFYKTYKYENTDNKETKFFDFLDMINKHVTIITSNIDNCYKKTDNINIIDIYGSLNNFYCVNCGEKYSREDINQDLLNSKLPRCKTCGEIIRPDIVFNDENVEQKKMDKIFKDIYYSDLIIVIGNSLSNYLLSRMIDYPTEKKVPTILINSLETPFDNRFDIIIDEEAENVLSDIVKILKNNS